MTNLSEDPANDYFADGLTDEIIRNLSIIDGLAVRSQTSSFAFKGKPQNIRDAGKQLDAEYILEGSVLRSGQQLRINAQLVRVRDDFPLWSGKYDRELTDVFAIQDEISRGIVNSLRLKLGRGRRRYETSAEAYDLYLRARALQIQRGLRATTKVSVPSRKRSPKTPRLLPLMQVSPRLTQSGRVNSRSGSSPDEVPKMRAAAEKAIQFGPSVSRSPRRAGDGSTPATRNGSSRRRASGARLSSIPAARMSHVNFAAFLLLPLGRIEEALEQLRIAEKADPLSPQVQYVSGAACSFRLAGTMRRPVLREAAGGLLGQEHVSGPGPVRPGENEEAIQILETAFNRGPVNDPLGPILATLMRGPAAARRLRNLQSAILRQTRSTSRDLRRFGR